MDFSGLLLSFRSRENILTDAGRFSATHRHLVGQLAACLYVFQSFLVPCALGVRGGAVLWYWQRTRDERTIPQWIVLGLALRSHGGCLLSRMASLLLVPLLEGLAGAIGRIGLAHAHAVAAMARLFARHLIYVCVFVVGLSANADLQERSFLAAPCRTGYAPGSLALEVARILECAVLVGSRNAQLDADSDPGSDRLAAFSGSAILRSARTT